VPRSERPASPRRLTRFGLALARPRAALALADDPDESGRAGTDLVLLLLLAVGAVHLRSIVSTIWLAVVIDPGLGLRALGGVIGSSVTTTLAWLLIGAASIWVAAGRRRSLGRDFDLACVAVVPIVVVEIVADLVVRALDLDPPPWAQWVIAGVGFTWASALILLGVIQARGRTEPAAPVMVPARAARAGLGAGLGVLGAAALVLAIQGAWVIGHLDWLRPMVKGDKVPAFAFAKIEAGGTLGAVIESENLEDRVVVLDFWETWCKPCRRAMPQLSALAGRGKGHIVVLSINLDNPERARELFDEGGYRHTLVAGSEEAAERFGVDAIPHLVVVDRGGIVRMVSRGEGNLQEVIGVAEELGGLHGHGK
jgi:thiol-disulfide isomerase/thioredoxin